MGINLEGQTSEAAEGAANAEITQSQSEITQIGDEEPTTQQTVDEAVEDSVITLQPSQPAQDSVEVTVPNNKAHVAPELRLIPGSPRPTSNDGEFSKGLESDGAISQRERAGGIV
jgi:hypothetical protein